MPVDRSRRRKVLSLDQAAPWTFCLTRSYSRFGHLNPDAECF